MRTDLARFLLILVLFRTNINPHQALDDEQLGSVFDVAQKQSAMIYALVMLLFVAALRIQDAVGLTF